MGYPRNNSPKVIPALSAEQIWTRKMAAHFDDDDNLWELAELCVDLFPPRRHANLLTDLDEVEFCTRFRDSGVL